MKYLATFYGRRAGAICAFYTCNVEIEANHTDDVRLKLYETHEHISYLRVVELPADSSV